jgi:hypothetical protein
MEQKRRTECPSSPKNRILCEGEDYLSTGICSIADFATHNSQSSNTKKYSISTVSRSQGNPSALPCLRSSTKDPLSGLNIWAPSCAQNPSSTFDTKSIKDKVG